MGKIADDRPSPDDRWLERIGGLSVREATALRIGDTLRIGTGATIPRSYAQDRARALFADALYRLVPASTAELVTPEALVQSKVARIRGRKFNDPERLAASEHIDRHVLEWQRRYRLRNFWVRPAVDRTLALAVIAREQDGIVYDGPVSLSDPRIGVHDGLEEPLPTGHPFQLRATAAHEAIQRSIYLDDLKYPAIKYDHGDSEDEGDFGTFDPRTEPVEAAVKRLLLELESRLRRALRDIAHDDVKLNSAREPVTFRKTTAFDWLVRYQVLGESRAAIAKADGIDRSQVSKKVNETAELIGLTLRKEKGGRPRNARSNTKRVR